MKRVINHLVQLQELTLIREQEAYMGGARLKQVDDAIRSLTGKLPPDVRTRFQKLQKKDRAAVIPATRGICSVCGMKLAVSLVQLIRAEEKLQSCPNCGRILYYCETTPRGVAQRHRRTAPPKVGIHRFSAPQLMIPRLASRERDDVVVELAEKMESERFIEHSSKLVEGVLRREAIMPTCVGHGVAFPHVRGAEGGGLTLALGLSPKGIKFCDTEKTLTRIVFLVAIPTAANAFYLKLVAGLAETFRDTDARKALLAEKEPARVWRVLKKLTRKTIP